MLKFVNDIFFPFVNTADTTIILIQNLEFCGFHDASGARMLRQMVSISGVSQFARDESGATAIEYGLIVALVTVGGLAAMTTLGSNVEYMYNSVVGPLVVAALGTG